jgi:spore maturation protein SpmB
MAEPQKKTIIDAFLEGARRGLDMTLKGIMPNVVMAFVIIHFLNITGILDVISNIAAPVMALFGLPGAGFAAWMAGWLSLGGGVGAALALYSDGALVDSHMTILLCAFVVIGAQLQYMGRIMITAGTESKVIGKIMLTGVVMSFIVMFLVQFIA